MTYVKCDYRIIIYTYINYQQYNPSIKLVADRPTDRLTNRQTDRQTDRPTL